MSPQPRPILKRQESLSKHVATSAAASHPLPFATCGALFSPHVHFPPTPSIVASTHPAHSPRTYDRKPIRVAPNVCDLPPRGDRKRLYSPPVHGQGQGERKERGRGRTRNPSAMDSSVKGSYFHPRAFEACEPECVDDADDAALSPPPALLRQSSSDEEDSDADEDEVMTPPDPKLAGAMPPLVHGSMASSLSPPPGLDKPFAHPISDIEAKHRPQLVRSDSTVVVPDAREFSPALEGF